MTRLFLLLVLASSLAGQGLEATLPGGVRYVRPAGGNVAWNWGQADIVDLRYLPGPVPPRPPAARSNAVRLVLVGPTTDPALLAELPADPSVVTLGPASPAVVADLLIPADAAADRQAFDDAGRGVPLEDLLREGPGEKTRYDESALLREHEGEPPPETAARPDAVPDPDATEAKLSPQARDRVLAEAHRLALGLRVFGGKPARGPGHRSARR